MVIKSYLKVFPTASHMPLCIGANTDMYANIDTDADIDTHANQICIDMSTIHITLAGTSFITISITTSRTPKGHHFQQ